MTYKRIGVPVDFSDLSIEALDYAIDFARSHRAGPLIIHMVEPIMHTRFIPDVAGILEQQRADAAEKLAQQENSIRRRFTRFRIEIHFGAAHEQIAENAQAYHGYPRPHWLSTVFRRSVAERVVSLASCPVLTLKSKKVEAKPGGMARNQSVRTRQKRAAITE